MFNHPDYDGHEALLFTQDAASGLRALIAIHDTTLGPAFGGCRMYPYASKQHAMTDVLRLSRGMTYKAAICELPYGGGKSVMIADPRRDKTPPLLHAMGRIIEGLGGRYITADDVGTTLADLIMMREVTCHTAGTTAAAQQALPATAFQLRAQRWPAIRGSSPRRLPLGRHSGYIFDPTLGDDAPGRRHGADCHARGTAADTSCLGVEAKLIFGPPFSPPVWPESVVTATPANTVEATLTVAPPGPRNQPTVPTLAAAEIAGLLARGDWLFATGDVALARLLYERAADAGEARAAVRLGETFDPLYLDASHRRGLHGDPDMAVLWYRHARDLGATGVASRLKKLEAKEGGN